MALFFYVTATLLWAIGCYVGFATAVLLLIRNDKIPKDAIIVGLVTLLAFSAGITFLIKTWGMW